MDSGAAGRGSFQSAPRRDRLLTSNTTCAVEIRQKPEIGSYSFSPIRDTRDRSAVAGGPRYDRLKVRLASAWPPPPSPRVSEARYRAAFQTSTEAIPHCRLATGNRSMSTRHCLTLPDSSARRILEKTPQEIGLWGYDPDEDTVVDLLQRGSQFRNLEIQFQRKNGKTIGGLTSGAAHEFDSQPHVVAITRDITERTKAAQEARITEQKFRQIFESVLEVFSNHSRRETAAVNPACAAPRRVLGRIRPFLTIWLARRARPLHEALPGGEIEGFCQVKCKDGICQMGLNQRPGTDAGADGKTLYYQGFIEDLTSRMAAEAGRRTAVFSEIFEDRPGGTSSRWTPEGKALTRIRLGEHVWGTIRG